MEKDVTTFFAFIDFLQSMPSHHPSGGGKSLILTEWQIFLKRDSSNQNLCVNLQPK
jgi:hypothetical protein